MKNEILENISPEEAHQILMRLAKTDPALARKIKKEAERLLKKIDAEEVCEDVYFSLDNIEVEELWDRSGSSRDGYSAPEEMAVEMVEKELNPHRDQVTKYLKLGMAKEARLYCMGVLKGIYKYTRKSESEFKDWTSEAPEQYFACLLAEWKKKTKNKSEINEMDAFLKKECPDWA